MDLSEVMFTVRKGDLFVDVDRGYVGYGKPGNYTIERLSHFVDWGEVPSVKWLRAWAKRFLDSLVGVYR